METLKQILLALLILAVASALFVLAAVGGIYLQALLALRLPAGVPQAAIGLILLVSWVAWGRKVDEESPFLAHLPRALLWSMGAVVLFFTAFPLVLDLITDAIEAPHLSQVVWLVAGFFGIVATFWISVLYGAAGYFRLVAELHDRFPTATAIVGGILYVAAGILILLLAKQCGFRGFGT